MVLHQGPVLRRVEVLNLLEHRWDVVEHGGGNQCACITFCRFQWSHNPVRWIAKFATSRCGRAFKIDEVAAHFTESIAPNMFSQTTTDRHWMSLDFFSVDCSRVAVDVQAEGAAVEKASKQTGGMLVSMLKIASQRQPPKILSIHTSTYNIDKLM